VTRENAGVVVAPSRPDLLAAEIAMLADDQARRASLAACSLAAARKYSRERQAADMEAALTAVVLQRTKLA